MGGSIMITASDFVKWLQVFNVVYGGHGGPISFPLIPSLGGTGSSAIPSVGQIPIGDGSNYVAANLTAGSGIAISNASGAITISSTDAGPNWNPISGTSQTAAAGQGYVCLNSAQTTVSLPDVCAFGDTVTVVAYGAGGFLLVPGTFQTIRTPTGTASTSIASAEAQDAVEVVCVVANSTWQTLNSSSTGLVVT